ncbi:MAG: phosphoglycerate kinase [marine bacterium B5-7]|nr:MAG: phosphoglycerate kinase [marine bacterium B5-7]
MKTLKDIDFHEKRVMIREDFNVPIHNGIVTSDARLLAALPTIKTVLAENAAVILLSHRGRPSEGAWDADNSLQPVAIRLAELLQHPVRFEKAWLDGLDIQPGEIVLCENVRFNVGEKSNDDVLAKRMAALCDVFVMDAFATAHRAQASTSGVAQFAPMAVAGPLLQAEVEGLQAALHAPKSPVVAIVGGSKVSTKLGVLKALTQDVDHLIVGGGIANTFLLAGGFHIGQSLVETDFVETAKQLLQSDCHIPLPVDVVVAKQFSADAEASIKSVNAIADDDMILDIGPETAKQFATLLQAAGTIVWNGPVGVFEWPAFAEGTRVVAQAVAASSAYSIAGGGDTIAAIEQFGVCDQISQISTGGGAFLEMMEGKLLPGVLACQR